MIMKLSLKMQKRGLFINLSTSLSNVSQPFRAWRAPFNKIAQIRSSNLDCKMLKKKYFWRELLINVTTLFPLHKIPPT